MQRKHDERDPVGDQIAARVVRQLMRERQCLLIGVVAFLEVARKRHVFAPDPERERSTRAVAFDHPHRAEHSRAGIGEHRAHELAVANQVPANETERAERPDREQHRAIIGRGRHIAHRRGAGHVDEHHGDLLGGAADGRGGTRLPVSGQRRQQQPHDRQQPQRVGNARTKHPPHRRAQDQHEQHQQGGGDHRPGDHCLSAFSKASISAISPLVSWSRSARCATSGVSLPPNSRSISRCDSPAT